MNWYIAIWTLAAAALAAGVYQLGWRTGRQYGRDEQWVEDALAQGRRDAERRDARGRFRSMSGRN